MGRISDLKVIETEEAPAPVGPFSQAIVAGDFVYTSGCIAQNPETGKLVEGGIAEQTEQVFDNIEAILEAASLTLEHAVKTTVYLSDLADFSEMNGVYERRFKEGVGPWRQDRPARSTVEARLALDAKVEIEVIAYTKAMRQEWHGGPL